MRENKLHTPYGVRDYLPETFHFKKEIERRIQNVFEQYGYAGVESPMLEYIEVFEGIGSVSPKQMYKFIDRDGEILALRSDMTPAIARIAATNFGALPLRFFYMGNAFRYNESYQGKLREFTQAGIELIGIHSHEANAEVIAMAIQCLLSAGLTDFRVDIGQVQFLVGVLEEAGFTTEESMKVQNDILDKNYVAVAEAASAKAMPVGVEKLLRDLPFYMGSTAILSEARALVHHAKAISALDDLQALTEHLQNYGVMDYVRFDLSMTGHLNYYTGIIFSGYTFGTGFSVIDGGRYDHLLAHFGAERPSIGFGIKINELLWALDSQQITYAKQKTETLLVFTEESRREALMTAAELRRQNVSIETSLLGCDWDINIAYAKQKKFGGILYFTGKGHVTMFDIATDETNEISLDELLERA